MKRLKKILSLSLALDARLRKDLREDRPVAMLATVLSLAVATELDALLSRVIPEFIYILFILSPLFYLLFVASVAVFDSLHIRSRLLLVAAEVYVIYRHSTRRMFSDGRVLVIALVVIVVSVIVIASLLSAEHDPNVEHTTIKREPNSHFRSDGKPKKSYFTMSGAERAARSFEKDKGEAMNSYRCATGHHFHTGHANS